MYLLSLLACTGIPIEDIVFPEFYPRAGQRPFSAEKLM